MIEGLKVTIEGTELKGLCEKRSIFHAERAEAYLRQVANLDLDGVEPMQYTGGDPKRALRDKGTEHENASAEMAFTAAHINVNETYILDRSDLATLGITRSRY